MQSRALGKSDCHCRMVRAAVTAIANAYRGLNQNHVAEPDVTYIRHFSSNYTVQFQSQTEATGDGYWLLLNNHGLSTWGRCRDSYRRGEDGTWRFVHRLVRGDPAS